MTELLNSQSVALWREHATQLMDELEEARGVARHLLKKEECWSYRAELVEAYPWLKEGEPTATTDREDDPGELKEWHDYDPDC